MVIINYALKFLGEGLHAIQNIEAHGNIGKGYPIPFHLPFGVDDINYDWTDTSRTSVTFSDRQQRLYSTKATTETYLSLFFGGIN